MPLILSAGSTENNNVMEQGRCTFETAMPNGQEWSSGLTVTIDIQSPIPGEENIWKNLYTFSAEGSYQLFMIGERRYRVVSSAAGPWVWLNVIRERIIA